MLDEGYIKFNCLWENQPLNVNVPKELITWRDKMYDLGLIGHYKDLDVGYGNISIKIPEGILISGTQTGEISQIQPQHFTLVDKYDIALNTVWCKGPVKASSETMTHAAIYECNPKIKAVIHIHNLKLWNNYFEKLPTSDKKVPYGTPEMAYEIIRLYNETDLSKKKILIMGGHEEGIIAFGNHLEEAGNLILSLLK